MGGKYFLKKRKKRKEGRRWRDKFVSLPTLTAEDQTHMDIISLHTYTKTRRKPPSITDNYRYI